MAAILTQTGVHMAADLPPLFIGLMTGTSLDGIDAALVDFSGAPRLVTACGAPLSVDLRATLLSLQSSGADELQRSQLAGNALADAYADVVAHLLRQAGVAACEIAAIGSHGQTVRHRPDLGFTVQLNNPARLAERSGITVVADFRSRDIAAGGQGAPLVPAFHQAVFASSSESRVIVNIGGISNLSYLPPAGVVTGFDCGPGNVLLDGWISQHKNLPYDASGAWAASGNVHVGLLQRLLTDVFFAAPPPKSTGRDLFHLPWLEAHLAAQGGELAAVDVQATLAELTAASIADAIHRYCPAVQAVYLCGGGAHNGDLRHRLAARLPQSRLEDTAALGIAADWVEAAAFAWLARQTLLGLPGNLPAVTGAAGSRVLGAIYPR